jgi:p-cumate 2,3-dioxygenase alpha subunit
MELEKLIVDNARDGVFRVHRLTMTSPQILELEREQIFEKCWLYAGHESEIPKAGDYVRRDVGGRPVILIRGHDEQVRVLYNSCAHRGAMLCPLPQGNARFFQCFYHGWTFNNQGELVHTPDPDGYGPGFDKSLLGLKSPPRVENYRGFVFISVNPGVPDLAAYLGPAKVFLDLIIDQGEQGVKVVPGTVEYSLRANWKLMADNNDSYHVPTLHSTYLDYLAGRDTAMIRPEGRSWSLDMGNGHGGWSGLERSSGQYGAPLTRFSEDVAGRLRQIRGEEIARYGAERAEWWPGRVNLMIYPNLVFVGKTTMRTFWPVAPDHTRVTAWILAPKEEAGEALAQRLNDVPLFQGPGGFATPDDMEALESCQAGYRAKEVEWLDVSRGMHRAPKETDETHLRAFWRQWHGQILGADAIRAGTA